MTVAQEPAASLLVEAMEAAWPPAGSLSLVLGTLALSVVDTGLIDTAESRTETATRVQDVLAKASRAHLPHPTPRSRARRLRRFADALLTADNISMSSTQVPS